MFMHPSAKSIFFRLFIPVVLCICLASCDDDVPEDEKITTPTNDSANGEQPQYSNCVPRQQIACACPDGEMGIQVCASNGYGFSDCACGAEEIADTSASSATREQEPAADTEHGTASAVIVCSPGETQTCDCAGGVNGVRICNSSLTDFSACICDTAQ